MNTLSLDLNDFYVLRTYFFTELICIYLECLMRVLPFANKHFRLDFSLKHTWWGLCWCPHLFKLGNQQLCNIDLHYIGQVALFKFERSRDIRHTHISSSGFVLTDMSNRVGYLNMSCIMFTTILFLTFFLLLLSVHEFWTV